MNECKINVQNHIIEKILDALKTCSAGIGMSEKYDVKQVSVTDTSSTLIFTPKKGRELSALDFFWLGFFVARDY